MPDMSAVNNNIHFSMFKGEPGTRKSTHALSYPKPQYWFSFDGKMNALQLPMRLWGIDPKLVHYDDYTNWDSARMKLEQFQVNCAYKSIVIDSITSVGDYMLRQVRIKKKGKTTKSGGTAVRSIGDIEVNDIEDFNAESAGLLELIALTKDIHKYHKIDVILIAHVIRTESKSLDNKISVSRTIVTAGKKPAAKIPAYCDETYHFGIEQGMEVSTSGTYNIITSHAGEDYARTSLPLPQVIEPGNDPLYEKWIVPAIKKLNAEQPSISSF